MKLAILIVVLLGAGLSFARPSDTGGRQEYGRTRTISAGIVDLGQ